jgi:hypothetical protein
MISLPAALFLCLQAKRLDAEEITGREAMLMPIEKSGGVTTVQMNVT